MPGRQVAALHGVGREEEEPGSVARPTARARAPVPCHPATVRSGMLGPVPAPDELPDLASAVLDLVDEVPRGRVVTYGDLAAVVGCGPRQVGTVMARWGGAVAWWRVLRADGSPPPGLEREALSRYRAEGTALLPGGRRVDLTVARWALAVAPARQEAPAHGPDGPGPSVGGV
jgi:alkylated DNA nucleotide flippase Atl1